MSLENSNTFTNIILYVEANKSWLFWFLLTDFPKYLASNKNKRQLNHGIIECNKIIFRFQNLLIK